MAGIKTFSTRVVVLPVNDIDTDQIIPARFLKGTSKLGLGVKLFNDWRYLPDGSPNPDFVLNKPESKGSQVLLAGDNFGCGSSREHAPWALKDHGFLAVVATSFADIFKSNALKNGVLPVAVDAATHQRLKSALAANPGASVTVDLERTSLTLPDGTEVKFPVDPFSRKCLLEGVDELGYLQSKAAAIAAFEAARGV
jgi:3-isopropylmalate/(R)-2-methylmalate dehydratase small subunit